MRYQAVALSLSALFLFTVRETQSGMGIEYFSSSPASLIGIMVFCVQIPIVILNIFVGGFPLIMTLLEWLPVVGLTALGYMIFFRFAKIAVPLFWLPNEDRGRWKRRVNLLLLLHLAWALLTYRLR